MRTDQLPFPMERSRQRCRLTYERGRWSLWSAATAEAGSAFRGKPWNGFHLLKGPRIRPTFISVILKEKMWRGFLQLISCFCHIVCILEFFVLGVGWLVQCRSG